MTCQGTYVNMRDFLYLDERLLDQYLAQVEDGLYEEEREREIGGRGRSMSARLGAGPLQGDAAAQRSTSNEVERTRRQTPESRFNRLYSSLENNLLRLDESTSDVYGHLNVRSMLQAACYVDVPSIGRMLAQLPELRSLMSMAEAFASDPPSSIDPAAMDVISMIAEKTNGSVIATGELGAGQATLAFKLESRYLRVEVDELEGEAVVLGTVIKKWPEGTSHPIISLPGLNILSREERRKLQRSGSRPQSSSESIEIAGPCASLSIVAIFR